MAASEKRKSNFAPQDLSRLSEAERLQVLAVMRRAQDMDEHEETKTRRRPLEGQLYKYTNVMKGWQTRWFVLDPESGFLEYYEKEEHKKQKPRGVINLAASLVVPSDEDSQTFQVSATNGEVYKLRGVDAKERQQWVDRLRSTSEHHSANVQITRSVDQMRSKSFLSSAPPAQRSQQKSFQSGSTENVSSVAPPRAPAAHPHTIDPFREVKEYMQEAEDYSQDLTQKIDSLPHSGQEITGLDKDILLIKATSAATLQCLGHCLSMLQQKQDSHSYKHRSNSLGSIETSHDIVVPSLKINRSISNAGSIASPSGSFTSVSSLPHVIPEPKYDGPINHNEEVEDEVEYKDTDLEAVEEHKSIILHLLSQLKLGMDLTKVVLPTFILERRSLLEMFADCMAHPDIFLRIADFDCPEARMLAVLEWYLTSFHAGRQGSVAKKPYNPIIGETFHCSWKIPPEALGSSTEGRSSEKECLLIYCAEQVSHHPPVSAFYFECPEKNICVNASIWTKSKFMGMSIGVVMIGKVHLKLLNHDEEYIFSLPSAYARSILTTPWVELGDKVQITCQKTNYSAAVTFHTKPFYGGKLHRLTAEVKNGNTGSIVCKVQGEWNSQLEISYADGETKVVDVNKFKIWHKRVRPLEKQGEFESRKLWQHVTNALKLGDVNTATEHKRFLEERQREGEKHRRETNTSFPTQYFHKEEDAWVFKNMLGRRAENHSHSS
ncbi:hypothetical protein ACJMK2_020756 [Sinanodonta woodiana]|uniref:Oxysterol-binding protein n=1 Tax=Sinanodonta woodiana TaxID=1069815 RepID=A0ABD3U2U6_SINWO